MITIYRKDNQLNKWKTVASLLHAKMQGHDTSNIIVDSSDFSTDLPLF